MGFMLVDTLHMAWKTIIAMRVKILPSIGTWKFGRQHYDDRVLQRLYELVDFIDRLWASFRMCTFVQL